MKRCVVGVLLLCVAWSLAGCGGGGGGSSNTPAPTATTEVRGELVSADLVTSYDANELSIVKAALEAQGFTNLSVSYAVNTYKVAYKTVDHRGDQIDASGLLAIPRKPLNFRSPVLSFQNGTIYLEAEAPSNSLEFDTLSAVAAAQGYIVMAPDYIGHGASRNRPHPYLHAATLASASIDMVRASRIFLLQNSIATNGQIFLAGYSEGGYATLATQKSMEQDFSGEFSLSATAPAAGPYDMTQTAQLTLTAPTLAFAPHVAYVFKAYDTVYELGRISAIFQPAYVDVVNTAFDGTKSGSEIAAQLTDVTADLFQPAFLMNYLAGNDSALNAVIADNDIYDWAPAVPTRFFHGVDDATVPFVNAVTVVDAMQNNGAADVGLVSCDAGGLPADHDNCNVPYLNYVLSFFGGIATDL